MSLDRRLRSELEREAERIVPDVERNLGAVESRARRGQSIGWPVLIATTAVLALAVGLRLGSPPTPPTGASSSPGTTTAPSAAATATPESSSPSFDAIAGTYVVTLDSANPAVSQNRIGGTWTMRLAPTGELFLAPPAGFGSGTSSLSGLAFTLVADRFRSNIFYNDYCGSVGTYTWSRVGGQLSFAPIDDTCSIRRALLSTGPWRVGP